MQAPIQIIEEGSNHWLAISAAITGLFSLLAIILTMRNKK